MKRLLFLAVLTTFCWHSMQPQQSTADTVLLSDSGGTSSYGYGYANWDNFTAALDAATGNQVTVTSDFTNLSQMLSYDALFLDQRWVGGTLAASEISNLTTFAATGRKIVMIGENDLWSTWNNQILGVAGGSYSSTEYTGATSAVVVNDLTAGAPSLTLPLAGIATGGTALYDQNFATLWGSNENVLTILDVNVWQDTNWDNNNGGVFGTNVANWLADSSAIPEPCGMGSLFAVALLFSNRRRR